MPVANESRERFPRWVVRASLRSPIHTILVWTTLSILALPGVLFLRVETSTDSVLDRAADPWTFYQSSLETFGGDELVVVALSKREPFSADLLQETIDLTDVLQGIDGVRRVDSLATVPLIRRSEHGTLLLDAALENGVPALKSDRSELLSILRKDRIAPRSLISDDGRVVALNVFLDANLGRSFDDVITDIASRADIPGVRISGVPIFRTQINIRTGSEVAKFSAITVFLVAIVFRFLFGSFRASFVPIFVGGLGSWLVLGSMGGLAIPLSMSTMILPSVLLALGCAYSTHFIFAMGRETSSKKRRSAAERVALPIALSGLTTAIGFLAIAAVPIEALQQVGSLGALGAFLTTSAVLTLVPVILDRWPCEIDTGFAERWITVFAHNTILKIARRPKVVVLVGLLLGALGALGLTRLSLETDATKWFSKGTAVRNAYEGIRRDLSGISPINIVVRAKGNRHITDPEVLATMDGLARHLRKNPNVGKVLSIADPLLSVNSVFNQDGKTFESRESAEQYMLLLSSVEQIQDLIDSKHQRANMLVRVNDNGSDQLLNIAHDAEDWWEANGPVGVEARATGIMYEFARAENRIADGQIFGVELAALCIGLILLLIFRSWKLAGAALLANAIPMLIAFGGMGWLGVPLDAGTVLVANLALGIAVDDTIHFSTVYQDKLDLSETLKEVLPALASTTVAIGAGFCVLGFSEFAFTRNLGILTSVILALCFLADVLLLPCVLAIGVDTRYQSARE